MGPGDVLACAIARWTNVWGDTLLPGSVTMLLYGLAGLLMLQVARRTAAGDRRLWAACAALFFFQVVNTHLDLHAVPTAVGHCLARAQGWYHERGTVKLIGLALIGAAIAVVLAVATVAWWRSIRANTMRVAGVAIAFGFTLIKGTAINAAEAVYNQRLGAFRWADLLEYSGIVLAMAAAARRLHSVRPIPRHETDGG
jgi:hypothetical protein